MPVPILKQEDILIASIRSALSDAELVHRIGQAWRAVVPKKLMAGLAARPSKTSAKKKAKA